MSVYKLNCENTQNHVDVIIKFYCDAIKFVEKAKESIVINDYEASHNYIENAYKIISLMHSNLKVDCNEDLSIALDDHYDAVEFQLDNIQMNNCSESCIDVINDLKTIRSSWEMIAVKRANIVAQIAAVNENEPRKISIMQ